MSDKFAPIDDLVVVAPKKDRDITQGGIALPENAISRTQRGVVSAVGPGRILDNGTRSELAVKPGDEIIFERGVGIDLDVSDIDMIVIREGNVLLHRSP